jgi:hypothetical protein
MLWVTEQPLLGGVGLEAIYQLLSAAQRVCPRRSRRRTRKMRPNHASRGDGVRPSQP